MSNSPHQLEKNSLSLIESIIMGVAGTAPAFSIAATTGTLYASVGNLSPGSLFYCGLLMFGITLAYLHLNKLNAHAGAAYAWVGEEFHPFLGFFAGWALLIATAIFMVAGTFPAATATLALISPERVNDPVSVAFVAAFWLIAVGLIILKGIKSSSIFQMITTIVEIGILFVIMFVAFFKFYPNPVQVVDLHDFAITSFTPTTFTMGALTAIFFFWGWDVTLNLSEETSKAEQNPGRGAIIAMCIMLFTFIFFAVAMQMSLTSEEITHSNTNIVLAVADKLFPKPWSYMAVIAVMLSTVGTLETSILQFTRTMYAKGRDGVLNPRFAKLHPEWKTPWVSTILLVGVGLFLLFVSTFYPTVNQIVADSVTAISFQAAFYYSLTGLACAKKFIKLAKQSWSEFISLFLWPMASSIFLIFIGLYSLTTFNLTTTIVAVGGIAIGIIPYLLNVRNK